MRFWNSAISLVASLLLAACASIGAPDGGPYDEDPPVLVKATPVLGATNVEAAKIALEFNENIKLENAFEKVVVSPPQLQMPEIKYAGKKVTVELFDTLRPNTTYSIDFGDAIVDNNEGNPYENFAYVFSTGEQVDTLAVSGTVLNAQDLEPVKGIIVGLHSCLDDTAFSKLPFERVSHTDSRGRFTIKGIAPGKYRVYALSDAEFKLHSASPSKVFAAWRRALTTGSSSPVYSTSLLMLYCRSRFSYWKVPPLVRIAPVGVAMRT